MDSSGKKKEADFFEQRNINIKNETITKHLSVIDEFLFLKLSADDSETITNFSFEAY